MKLGNFVALGMAVLIWTLFGTESAVTALALGGAAFVWVVRQGGDSIASAHPRQRSEEGTWKSRNRED